MEFNIAVLQQAIAAAVPDREAVVWRERRITWGESAERVRRFANLLLDRGLGVHGDPATAAPWESVQDHLGVFMYNAPEYLEGVLGAHLSRLAPFNLNYRYTGAELSRLLEDARPGALLYHARLAPQVAEILDTLGDDIFLVQVADESGNELLDSAVDYESALAGAPASRPAPEPGPDDLHIVFTGGTTGLPKGVLWRIGDIVAGPLQLARRDGTEFDSIDEVVAVATKRNLRIMATPPFMHGAGLWVAMTTMTSGGTLIIQDTTDRFVADEVAALCEREDVSIISLVGDAMGKPLVDALDAGGADMTSVKFLNNGAAPMSDGTKRRLKQHIPGLVISDGLGSSESGNLAVRADGDTFTLDGGAVLLSEDRARELAADENEIGWLCTATRHARGYLGDRTKTEATFVEHRGRSLVISGDRARYRPDGTIELLGRDSMTINTGGEKVFAEEVEVAIRRVPGVADALVFGRPDERWGHEVVAVVQLEPDASITVDELRDAASQQLARYKLPRAVCFVPTVRRAANGKADYDWARSVVADDPLRTHGA